MKSYKLVITLIALAAACIANATGNYYNRRAIETNHTIQDGHYDQIYFKVRDLELERDGQVENLLRCDKIGMAIMIEQHNEIRALKDRVKALEDCQNGK